MTISHFLATLCLEGFLCLCPFSSFPSSVFFFCSSLPSFYPSLPTSSRLIKTYISNERKRIDCGTFRDHSLSSVMAKHISTWVGLRNVDTLSAQDNRKEGGNWGCQKKKKSVTGCRFDFILEGLVSFIPEGILHVGKNNTIQNVQILEQKGRE